MSGYSLVFLFVFPFMELICDIDSLCLFVCLIIDCVEAAAVVM